MDGGLDGGPTRYQIVGPVRAWRGGHELDLGSARQRAVLAVLLLKANQPVPPHQIVDAVWGDSPPKNGTNVVQKYVGQLRRALDPERSPRTPDHVLALTSAGYVLSVESDALDAAVFRRAVRAALAARDDGRPTDARRELDAALARWRSEPLAGLAGPLFDAARVQLTEERAAAVDALAEIKLDLGEGDRLIPELIRLVAESPFREQRRYLLMLALYRSDRRAEALAVFQETRRLLTTELGVEPGNRLHRLHQAILRADPGAVRETITTPARETMAPPGSGPPDPVAAPTLPRRPWWFWPLLSLAVAVPLLSFGLLTWVVFAVLAALHRSWPLAAAAAGYLVLLVSVMAIAQQQDPSLGAQAVGVLAVLILLVGGAVQAAVVGLRSGGAPAAALPHTGSVSLDLTAHAHRAQARRLHAEHPGIASQLRIGRPDLERTFDDGGLVDLNGVPEQVIATLPGLTAGQAQRIVADRRQRGGFSGVDDLVSRGLLPPRVAHALREIVIFGR